MSMYGSQKALNLVRRSGSKGDLTGGGTQQYARSEVLHGGGNGYDPYMDGYNTYTFSRSSMGGMASGSGGGMGGGMMSGGGGGMMSGGGGGMMSGGGGGMMSGGGGGMMSGGGGGMMSGGGGGMMSGTGGGMMMSSMGGGMSGGMMSSGMMSGMSGGMVSGMSSGKAGGMSAIHQRSMILQGQCQEYLKKAEFSLQSGGASGDAERYMAMAKETIEHLKNCVMDLRQLGQPADSVVRTLEICKDQLKGVHMAMTGSMHRRRSTRGSSGGWEEPGRSYNDAMAWMGQQKRLIETAPWGDDSATIQQQLINHQKFHSSIQRSAELDRARDDLLKKGDKGNLHALEQEWDSLQQMSYGRTEQLQELQQIIQEMSKEIMWVNGREEEELVFDWGDKNIEQYIPRKQESYSKLMSDLEEKEKDLNKLKAKVDTLLRNNHPASDKIEAYRDTLQTQWSWLLQITKCIDVHLKENAAYHQFFKEANETYSTLQKEHETVRKKFTCDKNTSLEDLLELLRGLEIEKETIMENKRQVQHLVSKSKSIVRLKPRNPEEKSSSPVIVKALCDFKQDQKVICKDNEAILKDNSQRSKWDVTGPGGLDMTVPSVCLIVPPPNPLSISLANKNEQYYEAILSIWNQLYINIKSLTAWQYCLLDIKRINSLTISMLAQMRPEEYRQIINSLETHFAEFKLSCQGSEMFAEDDKRNLENQFAGAQTHYDQLVIQLPTYIAQQGEIEVNKAAELQRQQHLIIIQQQQLQQQQAAAEEEARRLEEERCRAELKRQEALVRKAASKGTRSDSKGKGKTCVSSRSLSELHTLRLRMESIEDTLSQHVHICLGDDGLHDCGLKITQLEMLQSDAESINEEYLRLRERILKELEGMTDSDKSHFLRNEIEFIDQRLGGLQSSSSAYLQRLQALRDMLESVAQAEDIVKVHEARLTEKETTSLSPSEVEEYMMTLKNVKAELDQKRDVLASMEAELAKASHWNGEVGGPFHRCDMMLSKYTDEVGVLSDRWRRLEGQIDTRLQDLQLYHPQLQNYQQTSTSLMDWITATRAKQDALQATKIDNIQALTDHINNQKALNSEIKSRRETVERVLKDNEACVNSIKDYETDLASYTSGLETLLNIPIKRTMLKSPSMDLNQESTQLQTRYMELLTQSSDYYRFLGELLKNMEELKIRNTRIDLLEEELRLLRENVEESNSKNRSLEDDVSRFRLELSLSKDQLLSMEEVKQNTALQCNATKQSLDSTQGQLADLSDQVTRLNYLLEEEKRKRKLAEERYTQQQDEYDLVLKKRNKELETISWSKMEVEKSMASKDHETEQLRRQLAEESARVKELQKEISKVRSQCSTEINNLKLSYESQIHVSRADIQRLAAQREDDTTELQLQYDRMLAERRNLEEELRRLRMSISQAEEQRKRAEEETHSQRAVITEEGRRRRELESQVEALMRQRDEESSQYTEELAEVMKSLQEKSKELTYITHSLEEETRRRRTIEEGKGVLEQTLAQLQVKLTSSSKAATQLGKCEEGLQKMRLELERESRERSRVEQSMSMLQGRMKDLQEVRDGLESQVENLRKANQEEVARRRQVETELEKSTIASTEYTSIITTLRQSQDQASTSEKRGEEERLRLQEELRRLRMSISQAEEQRKRAEEETHSQRAVITEEGRRRRELESQMEVLMRKRDEESRQYTEELAEVMKSLQEKSKELTYITHSLEEETRRRRTIEEGKGVLEQTLAQLQVKLTSSSKAATQLGKCEEGLQKMRLELERESRERSRVEQSMSMLQGRMKDLQEVRDGLESQVENLRKANQEEVARRRQVETELEKSTIASTEYTSIITTLRQSQDQASTSEKRGEEERLRLQEELRRLRMSISQAEEQRKRAEEETHSQRAVITEEGRRRRELESQMEVLMRKRDEESRQYTEELAEVMKSLQEKSKELTYITHSLEEETRRRRTIEDGKGVLEQTLAQLQVKLTSSSKAATQLGKCEEELQKMRLELERESRERSRVEQSMSMLQGRMKDFQEVRDGLESQVENLRKANQEEVARRRQVETELEKSTIAITEYASTITTLRQSQDQASTSEKRGEEERLRLQEELERSLRQNKTSAERVTELSAELKALQQQHRQEQARVKEANLRNEGLYRTIEEKSKALNENSVELQRLKEMTETNTKERLRLEEELRTARHDKEELSRSIKGSHDELSSQITALELQLQASERSNVDYRNLVSDLSSEREKLKLETEKIQKQAIETTGMMQSIQSQYSEIVTERDSLLLKLQLSEKDKDRLLRLEEELSRIKLSLESELRSKQRLQEENERVKRDLGYWKDQYESKQVLIRQYDTEKERLDREKNSLKSEIERLMRELRELEETYKSRLSAIQKELREVNIVRQNMETELKNIRESPTLDGSTVVFDGVRKPVTANQLLDCGVLDKPTFSQLVKGHKTVPDVSVDKKVSLKGTGPIAGVIIEVPKGLGSITGPISKMTFTEAKRENLLPPDSVDLLLDAQAATGHIIDPRTNQKLTVEEACNQGVIDEEDRERLLAAEAAAVGYSGPGTSKPLSVFQAMKKGLIDKNTTLRLLQAQESTGGILDPTLSVFLPKDTAIERNLIDDDIYRALNKRPELYLDPESEEGVTYMSMKRRCKVEPHTGLLLLPIPEKVDSSKLVFDGVRKPVTANQLLDCGVLDKPTFKDLELGKKTVPEVSGDKNVNLKGTGPIAGVIAGSKGKMSLSEAKKQMLLPEDSADLLLEAQAATGHIIDPTTNQKLTVEEACARGVVDNRDRDRLLAAEAAAVGYRDPSIAKPLSVFEAMKKGLIDSKTGVRLLQAQESVGGILDPNLSVFLPKDTAIKRNLLDENLRHALKQSPGCYLDPETEHSVSYGALKKRCKTEPHTGLLLLPITEKLDPSKLIFDGVRKPVTAQQLLDCGILDKPTFSQLVKGEKTVPEVSMDKKVFLKGTGSIAGVAAGPLGKMSLSEAKKQMLMPPDSADLLLEAQAATGHIIDPRTNQKLTVEEACAKGVVDNRDRDRLLEAEAAAVGYRDPSTAKPLSVFEAMRKGLIDRKTGLRLLQAQESAGGILDPNLSVFLPRDTAIKRNLLDEDLCHALNKKPECYLDPDTEHDASYGALKKRCKTESHTGLILLPITERKDPSKIMFDGVRKPVSAQQLFECGVLDKPTFNQLVKGEKTVPAVSAEKMVYLKGTGPIAGVVAGDQGRMSLSEAKKQELLSEDSADLLLDAQAATGHIIDPKTDQKLTVEEACARGVVDIRDRDRLLAAEAAAVGYKDRSTAKPLSVFEAMKKGLIDSKTGVRLLQAQESVGGILDPNLSVFLPKDTAIKRNLLDENLCRALKQSPGCYLDPETEHDVSYGALKERCKTEPHTGLKFLPVSEKVDPCKLLFDGVHKPVTAQQLLDCGVLDKPTFNKLMKGEKTVSEVSVDKKVFLKGTGSIAGVAAGPLRKMSFTEAKKQKIMSSDSADMLLVAQAATGHIIDPRTNQKLTVKEACARGVVDKEDESMLFAAEAGAIGYRDPNTAQLLSAGQAMKKGLIDKDTALRVLQAQESVGGILDPALGVFLPKDVAMDRGLIDEDIYRALSQYPECYLDPDTQQASTYVSLKKKCRADPSTGLLLLPEPKKPVTVQGLRGQVSVIDLVDANLLERSDMDKLRAGRLTSQDIENRLHSYLRGSTCIAGVYDEASDKVMPIYQAMKDGLLRPGTTLELLEAQAASGFIVDPVNKVYLNVSDAYNKRLFGPEFKDSLLSAERAVTGYKLPGTDKVISLFQAIERGLVEKGHGIRLLEAQIASGGIIDPEHSHRIDVNVAYKRGYFDKDMNKILNDQTVDTKGFFDPNTEENLTYQELKKCCITDKKTGLILLPIMDKKKLESTLKNTTRKRRVIIVDPETNREMTVREAYDKGYIDYDTFLELSEQECEWEEITITAPDGSTRIVIIDKKTGRQYDITELLEKRIIDQSVLDQYQSHTITLTEFADIITHKTRHGSSSLSSSTSRPSAASGTSSVTSSSSTSKTSASLGPSSVTSSSTSRTSASLGRPSVTSSSTLRTSETSVPLSSSSSSSSSVLSRPLSPTLAKMTTTRTTTVTERSVTRDPPDSFRNISSVSINLASPVETVSEQEPVGAIFDTESVEKISITEALYRGLVDSITAQRLLEAQACTGGIINPTNGHRLTIQEATRLGIIDDDMASKLKPAQKAYIGFEDVKAKRKLSAAEAVKETWLPYEAGQRFMEFQLVTGGLCDPEMGCRRTIEDAVRKGWLNRNTAQKLQDNRQHTKNLTCPKSKLKISYKEALDNCLVEEDNGVKMLPASSVSSRGISSPYNVSSAPGSTTGSRSGSRRSSRRSSVDLGSPTSSSPSRYSLSSFTTFSATR